MRSLIKFGDVWFSIFLMYLDRFFYDFGFFWFRYVCFEKFICLVFGKFYGGLWWEVEVIYRNLVGWNVGSWRIGVC